MSISVRVGTELIVFKSEAVGPSEGKIRELELDQFLLELEKYQHPDAVILKKRLKADMEYRMLEKALKGELSIA